jgi:PilZ domain
MSTFGKCEGGGRRSAARIEAPLIALITTLNETRSAVVVDVSSKGARLRGKNLPPKWADLFIHVEGIVGFGTVQWEEGDERGIAFDVALHPDDEQLLRQKIGENRGMPPEIKAAFDDWTQGVVH